MSAIPCSNKTEFVAAAVHNMDRIKEAADRVQQNSELVTIKDAMASIRLFLDDLDQTIAAMKNYKIGGMS